MIEKALQLNLNFFKIICRLALRASMVSTSKKKKRREMDPILKIDDSLQYICVIRHFAILILIREHTIITVLNCYYCAISKY